jgi:hypothetical protein
MDDEDKVILGGKSDSFVSYLTTISPVEKNELLNVFQYILLAVIPLVLFLKFMKEYMPAENPTKSTIEITTEVVIQLFLIFVVFWFIHKVILYIPTYSTAPYEKLNLIQLVLPVVFLLFCMKSSISEKMSILLERALVTLGLKPEGMCDEEPKKKKGNGQNGKNVQSGQGQCSSGQNMLMGPQLELQMPQMARQMPTNTSHESREMPEMNMNYGINEPVASNEMGCSFVNY